MAGDPAIALSCEGLTKRFAGTVAIDALSLSVSRGEIVAMLGPSGCGKTTFLRLVAGFERPDAGTVSLAGETVTGNGSFVPPERRRVGFVFQDYALFPHLSVAGNVGFGLADRRARSGRVGEVLDLVGLAGLGERYPHELSGGQQQRVALARALAPAPATVLLDEPFSNLDADLRARVRTEVREILRAAGATAVFVTHDQEEAFAIGDRVAVLRAGRIEQVGRPEDVYHTPATRFVADFVGEADFLPAEVRERHVVSELGRFSIDVDLDASGPVEIMVRPEDLSLSADPGADARVIDRRFRGPVAMTVVRLGSGRIVTAAHSSQTVYPIDERVAVRFRPDHLVLFRGEKRVAWSAARERTGTDPTGG